MRIFPKSSLVAAGVALALAAGAAVAQSGTSQPPESPPTAVPPTSAPPPDQQAAPSAVPPASSTPTPATQSSSAVPPAAAAPAPVATASTFEDLDQNKDSGLGKDEVIADMTLSSSFATYDSDGDGKLNREEYAKYKSKAKDQPEKL
jgi:hypothetical protein